TIGTNHDGAGFATDLLGLDIAGAVTESVFLVMTDERLAAGIDHDHPARFGEDLAAALVAFLPRATEVFHAARSLWRSPRSDRRERRSRRGCDRQWRGHGR